MINLELLGKDVAEKIQPVMEQVNEYINTDCILKKNELLMFIKEKTNLSNFDLVYVLFESERTIIRIHNVHKLIPELKQMYKFKEITAKIAYGLALLSEEEQLFYYKHFQELILIKQETYYEELQQADESKVMNLKKNVKRFTKISVKDYQYAVTSIGGNLCNDNIQIQHEIINERFNNNISNKLIGVK